MTIEERLARMERLIRASSLRWARDGAAARCLDCQNFEMEGYHMEGCLFGVPPVADSDATPVMFAGAVPLQPIDWDRLRAYFPMLEDAFKHWSREKDAIAVADATRIADRGSPPVPEEKVDDTPVPADVQGAGTPKRKKH